MTTNELMRHLLTDIPAADQRHLVEIVDRNHAEQLARKRRSGTGEELSDDPYPDETHSDARRLDGHGAWDDDSD